MHLTLEISWWIIPALVTLAAFVWALMETNQYDSSGYLDLVGPIVQLLCYGLATIASLVAWLAWAVLS